MYIHHHYIHTYYTHTHTRLPYARSPWGAHPGLILQHCAADRVRRAPSRFWDLEVYCLGFSGVKAQGLGSLVWELIRVVSGFTSCYIVIRFSGFGFYSVKGSGGFGTYATSRLVRVSESRTERQWDTLATSGLCEEACARFLLMPPEKSHGL